MTREYIKTMVKAYILVSFNPPIVASRGVGSAAGPRGGTGGVPGGYPYIPPTYGYGSAYIYPLYVPMGVPIYTWGGGGG